MIEWLYRLADRVRNAGRRRKWQPHLAAGRRAEDLAHRFLEKRGMTIVARNYRAPFGGADLDLVGMFGDLLTFVEVKSRSAPDSEPPERAVDEEKRRGLARTARHYIGRAGAPMSRVRFDIVSVRMGDSPRIDWFPGAFKPPGTL